MERWLPVKLVMKSFIEKVQRWKIISSLSVSCLIAVIIHYFLATIFQKGIKVKRVIKHPCCHCYFKWPHRMGNYFHSQLFFLVLLGMSPFGNDIPHDSKGYINEENIKCSKAWPCIWDLYTTQKPEHRMF